MSERVGALGRGARPFLAASFGLVLAQAAAQAQPACLDDGSPATLSGTLRERRLDAASLRQFPAVSRGPFYILDLDRPICFNGSFSGTVLKDVRSIHVFSLEKAKLQLLRRYDSRRVSVRFVSLFEEHTAHHMRPVVGQAESLVPLGRKR
ncbi:MAG TPA: hypothetical protein VF601_01735 [Beijerinckiaceae bacterium]|jgi:hypothetical protein